jgi:hypothetical protein
MAMLIVTFLNVVNTSENVFCYMNCMKRMHNGKAMCVCMFHLQNCLMDFK